MMNPLDYIFGFWQMISLMAIMYLYGRFKGNVWSIKNTLPKFLSEQVRIDIENSEGIFIIRNSFSKVVLTKGATLGAAMEKLLEITNRTGVTFMVKSDVLEKFKKDED